MTPPPFVGVEGRLLAHGTHAGLDWCILRSPLPFRCGYVRLPLGHPWWGNHRNAIRARVHGGVTFSEVGDDGAWWIGFDCGHAWDLPDPELAHGPEAAALIASYARMPTVRATGEIRTTAYVQQQCEALCEQAAAARVSGA